MAIQTEYVTADGFSNGILDETFTTAEQNFCKFLQENLTTEEFNRVVSKRYQRVCYGGSFAVRSASFFRLSLNSWKRIATALGNELHSERLHFMERSWAALLSSDKDITSIAQRSKIYKSAVVKFRDQVGTSYPGLLHITTSTRKQAWLNPSQAFTNLVLKSRNEELRLVVVAVHNLNLEGSTNYARQLVQALVSFNYDVVVVALTDGPAKRIFQNDGASDVIVSSSLSRASISEINTFISLKLAKMVDAIIFNTVVWSSAIVSNDPLLRTNPYVVWVLHEWAISEKTQELNVQSQFTWYGTTHQELLTQNVRGLLLGTDAVVFVAEAQRRILEENNVNTFTIPGYADSFPEQQSQCKQFSRTSMGFSDDTLVLTMVGTLCPRNANTGGSCTEGASS